MSPSDSFTHHIVACLSRSVNCIPKALAFMLVRDILVENTPIKEIKCDRKVRCNVEWRVDMEVSVDNVFVFVFPVGLNCAPLGAHCNGMGSTHKKTQPRGGPPSQGGNSEGVRTNESPF